MAAFAQKSMTTDEFVAWTATRPEKHWELFDGAPSMQQSQTWGHATVKYRIARVFELEIASKNLPLSFGVDGLVVKAGDSTAFEPDVVVFAGVMGKADIITPDPKIVVEVLSPSTARKDLTVKLAGYFKVPTIQHYVIADWETSEFILYSREGSAITPPLVVGQGELLLEPPGIALSVAQIFA